LIKQLADHDFVFIGFGQESGRKIDIFSVIVVVTFKKSNVVNFFAIVDGNFAFHMHLFHMEHFQNIHRREYFL